MLTTMVTRQVLKTSTLVDRWAPCCFRIKGREQHAHPLYSAISLRAGGCRGRQVTLSSFYGLEVRAVTAFIRLDKRSWPCRCFIGWRAELLIEGRGGNAASTPVPVVG